MKAVRARKFAGILLSLRQQYWRLTRKLTVGVRLLAVEDGKVLLVRHTYQDGWYLPGGGVQAGESLQGAMRREADEEVRAVLHDLQLFGVYSSFFEGKSDHIVVFQCENFSWQRGRNREISCVNCFSLDKLPEGTSPGTRRRIAEYATGKMGVAAPW